MISPLTRQVSDQRVQGPVEILCKEISYPYDLSLERTDIFVAFVEALVDEVSDMIAWRSAIYGEQANHQWNTSDAAEALVAVKELVKESYRSSAETRATKCADLHNDILHEPDDGPCNRFIGMLSSCVSAVRFGLEIPCRSRHAAEAASHIWKYRYGVTLFDRHTTKWEHDWARHKLHQAIMSLLPANSRDSARSA